MSDGVKTEIKQLLEPKKKSGTIHFHFKGFDPKLFRFTGTEIFRITRPETMLASVFDAKHPFFCRSIKMLNEGVISFFDFFPKSSNGFQSLLQWGAIRAGP